MYAIWDTVKTVGQQKKKEGKTQIKSKRKKKKMKHLLSITVYVAFQQTIWIYNCISCVKHSAVKTNVWWQNKIAGVSKGRKRNDSKS